MATHMKSPLLGRSNTARYNVLTKADLYAAYTDLMRRTIGEDATPDDVLDEIETTLSTLHTNAIERYY